MKNRTMGSVFIVAGTTIGAGMLAMPLAAAGVGFSLTLIILCLLWALMCYTALLLVEAYQHVEPHLGLGSLAQRYLGKVGASLTSFSMLFLLYALTAAYISGGGELMTVTLSKLSQMSLPDYVGSLVFAALGFLVVTLGTHSVDLINRILFTLKFVFLVLVFVVMVPHVDTPHLLSMPLHQGLVISAIPIIFTSFGFHGSIPSIVQYLNGDSQKLRRVFILGSLIPLVTYLFWQLVIMGTIDSTVLVHKKGLNGLLASVREVVGNPWVETALHRFADLALATSFLGVSLGLFDHLADLFKRPNHYAGRLQTGGLTFIPPLVFALFYPQGFQMALAYAAVALAFLALILPASLVWRTRQLHQGTYRAPGGRLGLVIALLAGVSIILIVFSSTI